MKKYFFGAIIALSLTTMSAKPNVNQCEISNPDPDYCCACDAWDYGTMMEILYGIDSWAATDYFYRTHCE